MRLYLMLGLLVVLGLWTGCANGPSLTGRSSTGPEASLQELERRLIDNPNDAEALRDLGVAHLRMRDFSQANTYLNRAFDRTPNDPKTLFHLGVVNEALGRPDTALRLYGQYANASRQSEYRGQMEGRYNWLVRQRMREEMQALLEADSALVAGRTGPIGTVAVFPFTYTGEDDQYAVLGRGISEMISVDLTNVNSLQVVERVRLQALLNEIELGQQGAFDQSTTPRAGQLLGAGRVIGGSLNVLGGSELRVDAAQWELSEGIPDPATLSGPLQSLFDLEKELVFNLIEEMGIELTPDERERIQFIPTHNLQAFLAYSRGLQEEDAGNFGQAAQYFDQAVQIDPSFDIARDRSASVSMTGEAAQPLDVFIASTDQLDPLPEADVSVMVDRRLEEMGRNLGTGRIPGQDSRKPSSEVGGVDALPRPPPPPDN